MKYTCPLCYNKCVRDVKITEWSSLEHLFDNKDYYKEMFLNDKIIAFRNVNADLILQEKIMLYFGDLLGWYPNSENSNPSHYFEDHHKHMINNKNITKDELILSWHIEWVEQDHIPHYGSTWNMTKFDCNYDTGNTCFVDMAEVYNLLDQNSSQFLEKCDVFVDSFMPGHLNSPYPYIKEHWITNEKCVRPFLFDIKKTSLVLFDKKQPTENENKMFESIHKFVYDTVHNNLDIRYVHRWQKGDLLVPDLFKLAHAVTGGFKENERRLDGMFGKSQPWDLMQ